MPDGRRIHLLARGEMLNLAAATGHQIEVMDLAFALQAHAMRPAASRHARSLRATRRCRTTSTAPSPSTACARCPPWTWTPA